MGLLFSELAAKLNSVKTKAINQEKNKKKLQSNPQLSNLNIISNKINRLGSKKASLEDIIDTNNINIFCVQEVNIKNPPRFKDYVLQFNRFSKLRMH